MALLVWLSLFGRVPFDGVLQAEVQKVHRLHAEVIVGLIEAGVDEGSCHCSRKPVDIAIKFISAAFGLCVPMVADPQAKPPERRGCPPPDIPGLEAGVAMGDTPQQKQCRCGKLIGRYENILAG
ncbi:hypothetical protein ACVBGC_34885 [Burkholderia stagnalis]